MFANTCIMSGWVHMLLNVFTKRGYILDSLFIHYLRIEPNALAYSIAKYGLWDIDSCAWQTHLCMRLKEACNVDQMGKKHHPAWSIFMKIQYIYTYRFIFMAVSPIFYDLAYSVISVCWPFLVRCVSCASWEIVVISGIRCVCITLGEWIIANVKKWVEYVLFW